VKPAPQIAPDGLVEPGWHQGAGECEAPTAISNPPRFRGSPDAGAQTVEDAAAARYPVVFGYFEGR
jgi:hypothetical protein